MGALGKFSVIFALFLALPIVYAQVAITPSNPSVSNDITCILQGANPSYYTYQWYLNGQQQTQYSSNILPHSALSYSQTWKCKIYIPPTGYTGTIFVGEASVTTQAQPPVIPPANKAPNASFTSNAPKAEGTAVSFTDASFDVDGSITSRLWRFGDGATSTAVNPSHTYTSNKTYVANLTVTDNGGSIVSTIRTIVVTDTLPQSNFSASRFIATTNQTVSFTDLSTAPVDPIVGWSWNFGDSTSSTQRNPSHKFTSTGNYSVTLTVTDNDGSSCSACITRIIEIRKANLYGVVTDTDTGAPIAGANLSFYPSSYCALDDISLSGSCSSTVLNPKPTPDAVSDSNGHYSAYLQSGTYQMVIQHSKQVDYNVIVNASNPKSVNAEIKENQVDKNVNFEGHIIYAGQYRDGNKYIMGDTLTFVMFGVDNAPISSKPINVTYLFEDETSGGNSGPWVLNGTWSSQTQVLSVPGGGNKVSKLFNVTLDSRFKKPGRYDIHVMYNNSGMLEKWHKIGNFFIKGAVNDTVALNATTRDPPILKFKQQFFINNASLNIGQYMGQSFNVSYQLKIPAETATIPNVLILTTGESDLALSPPPCQYGAVGDEVSIFAPNANITVNGQTRTNRFRINVTNARNLYCTMNPVFLYPKSDYYKVNISLKEQYYGAVSPLRSINVTSWASEQLARDIYYDITQIDLGLRPANKPVNFTGYYRGDHCGGTGGYCGDSTFNVTRFGTGPTGGNVNVDVFATSMGFEYRSAEDGYDNENPYCNIPDMNNPGATDCERNYLNNRWHIPNPDYILVSDPMTKDDLAHKITSFAEFIVINNTRSP